MIKYLIFDRGDTVIEDLPESFGGMAYWPYYKAVDGIVENILKIYKKYTCIIASNTSVSTSSDIKKALKEIGINKCFKYIFTQNELKCAKPNKDFFINILNILQASPSEVCMIGNSYRLDITPCKQLGIHTILFNQSKNNFPDADYVISDFKNLNNILEELNNAI